MSEGKQGNDRFGKFGIVGFTSITKTNDFVDYLEKGQVMGTRCRDCGRSFFPPRADCCQCFSDNTEWFEITGRGKLVTYSRLEYAPAGFETDLPYCIGLVDFGHVKVFGRISREIPDNEIKSGMEMGLTVKSLPGGRITYVFDRT